MGNHRHGKKCSKSNRAPKQGPEQVQLGCAANLATKRVMVRVGGDNRRVLHLNREQGVNFAVALLQCCKAISADQPCETCDGMGAVEQQEYDGGPWETVLCKDCQGKPLTKTEGPSGDEPPAPHSSQHREEPKEEPPRAETNGQVVVRDGMSVKDKLDEIARLRGAVTPTDPDPSAASAAPPRGQLGQ